MSRFSDIVVQDGSSFAVHDDLAEIFGRRFTKISPAAVELHACASLLRDEVIEANLAPDKDPERAFLPAPEQLRGNLLLADRGYQSLDYWEQVMAAGGYFIMRAKCDLNPRLLRVRGPGGRLEVFEGRYLQEVLHRLPRRRLDLEVEWDRPGDKKLRPRIVLNWTPHTKQYMVLVTNVGRRTLAAKQVAEVYWLRWQVELIFKEWKSYANLHAFASANPALVEGLIWASLCAAAIKRSLAHASQRSGSDVAISTRTTAMCGAHILPRLLRCALEGFQGLGTVLETIFRYLWNNAPRAHPERDRTKGRMRFGLEYVGVRS